MTTRRVRAGVGAAALAVVLAGCGGGGGGGGSAPDNASTEDFCEAYTSMLGSMMSVEPDSAEAVSVVKEWGEKLEEVGTPEDIPDEAREGFEVIVESLSELDADATEEQLDELGGDLSAEEEQATEAFGEYVTETCPMEMPEMPELDEPTESQ